MQKFLLPVQYILLFHLHIQVQIILLAYFAMIEKKPLPQDL